MTGRFDFEGVLESLGSEGPDSPSPRMPPPSALAKFASAAAPLGVAVSATFGDALRREGDQQRAGPGPVGQPGWPAPAQEPLMREPVLDVRQIEREIALSDDMSARDIARRRRQFLWDHHPDRSGTDSDAANRQAAIANNLFDKAIQNRRRK